MKTRITSFWPLLALIVLPCLAEGQTTPSRLYLQRPVETWAREALVDTAPRLAARGILALRRMGPLAQHAMPLLQNALRSEDSRKRLRTLLVLSAIAPSVEPPLPDIIAILHDTSAAQVTAALRALSFFGPRAAGAGAEAMGLLGDQRPLVRAQAISTLMDIAPPSVDKEFAQLLNDAFPGVRASAVEGLSRSGSSASVWLPAIARLLQDSVPWVARAAAAAANAILVQSQSSGAAKLRRGVAMILTGDYSLRSDGEATYVDRMDNAQVIVAGALHLLAKKACDIDIGDPNLGGCETQMFTIPIGGQDRRSIAFDLSQPVPGSGSKSLGVVRDFEGVVDVFWKRDPNRPRAYLMMRNMPVGHSQLAIERVSMNIAIQKRPHILQFGSWGTGQVNPATPQAGGEKTTGASIVHASPVDWVVHSAPNSVGRLWDVSDPDQPVDRGLYRFSFAIRFMELSDK